MAFQVEDLNNPFPYRLPLKRLFHGYTFNVCSLSTVQSADHVSQFLNVIHRTPYPCHDNDLGSNGGGIICKQRKVSALKKLGDASQ